MRAVTAESLELCLLGNTPLYFQKDVVRAVYNPEQMTDLERCKSTQRSGTAISHTGKQTPLLQVYSVLNKKNRLAQ